MIVTDVNPLSPAVHVADRAYRVPMASDPAYVAELLGICEAEQVRLVVPTIDDELDGFARRATVVQVEIGVLALFARGDRGGVQRQVRHLARCRSAGFPRRAHTCRRICRRRGCRSSSSHVGRGAVGAFPSFATSASSTSSSRYVSQPIVQEYLDGPEFTIDVLCDSTAGRSRSCRGSGS